MRDGVTYVDFKINQDYYITNYCINIDQPELLCSGKCYLGEQLKQGQDIEKNWPAGKIEIKSMVYILPTTPTLVLHKKKIHSEKKLIQYKPSFYHSNYLDKDLQPPQKYLS